jgi:O-succinylbenzoic acid--CoA ligase
MFMALSLAAPPGPARTRACGWQAGAVTRLIALDLPGGPAFVLALQRCWDRGDAVLVLDPRLPALARTQLIAAARPHAAITVDDPEPVPLEPGAPLLDEGDALVVATSGSTGDPKVLVHTRAGLVAHATAVHGHLGVDPAHDRWLACLPLNHLGGFGVVARSVLTGTRVEVTDGFDAQTVAAAPARSGTTLVSLVATALDRIEPAAFRWVVLGGSADPVVRPPNVVRTYGLTETGGGVVYEGTPLPGTEVRVGDDGAIAIRSATTARGRRAPDGTVTPIVGADGWLATGDLGRWASDGRLQVDGRADDLIITGGENVWPGPVEDVLRTFPKVADALVIGEPDREWGEQVVAVVVPTDPASPPTLEQLRDHVKAHLPAAAAPRRLRLAPSIPRTSLGKPVRRMEPGAP